MKFKVTYIAYATLNLDDAVIEAVDDEWRKSFYSLKSPKEIAEHIGRNLILGARLSQLDGWADQSDMLASLDLDDEEIDAEHLR